MSIYKELNNLKVNVSEIEEESLSKLEQKRIIRQVKKEISSSKRKKKWWGIGMASVAACVLTLSVTMDRGTIASMPFIGSSIEKYINSNEHLDYSAYKTEIGETAENELGKLTLNEILLDDRQLFLSATFEPGENVKFNYKTVIAPTVKINGKVYTANTGAQSIELNHSMFTIYNDIELNQAIQDEDLQIEICYNNWNFEKTIEQPWTFNVSGSQAQLLTERKVFDLNKRVTLANGEGITIQKVVSTPISTTVYYDLTNSTREDIFVDIQVEDGKIEHFSNAFTSNDPGDVSYGRFNGLKLEDKKYFLVLRDFDGKQLYSEAIPIN